MDGLGELAAEIISKVPIRRCRKMARRDKTEDQKWVVAPEMIVADGDGAMDHYTNLNWCQRFTTMTNATKVGRFVSPSIPHHF